MIVRNNYVCRKTTGRGNAAVSDMHWNYRNWWLGKKQLKLSVITLPRELWGKRIRFKIEVEE